MADVPRRAARPGWIRDALVPRALAELKGPTAGSVGLPTTLFWSGPHPQDVRWDVTDLDRRRDLYEIVLVEGTLDDIVELVDAQRSSRCGTACSCRVMFVPPGSRSSTARARQPDPCRLIRCRTRSSASPPNCLKDAGFTTPTFVDALNAIRRLTDADWAEDGIDAAAVPEIHQVFAAWRDRLTAGG